MNKEGIAILAHLLSALKESVIKLDNAFLQSEKDKIYIINKEINKVNLEKLRINSMGLYFGVLINNKLRLSIEGSQIIGPKAKKNVLELDNEQVKQWLRGEDILFNNNLINKNELSDFVIIKNNNDFYGCGKTRDNKILNYMPKIRRVKTIS